MRKDIKDLQRDRPGPPADAAVGLSGRRPWATTAAYTIVCASGAETDATWNDGSSGGPGAAVRSYTSGQKNIEIDRTGLYQLWYSVAVSWTSTAAANFATAYIDVFDETQDPDVAGRYGGNLSEDTFIYSTINWARITPATNAGIKVVDLGATMHLESGYVLRAFLDNDYGASLTADFHLGLRLIDVD